MGLLAPLYLAGLTALALPLLFHLVRRTPRGRRLFSSLMFLTPSPPRLTRRSRLDQILLLLLRLAALVLLAVAFARPFLRESALLSLTDLPRRRTTILLDVSASMHRADLWKRAVAEVERELRDAAPHDEISLVTFADRPTTVVGFADDERMESAARLDVLRSQLKSLSPTWATSDPATALVATAAELEASSDVRQSTAEPRIVLIADMKKGCRIDALQSYEWPERVRLIVRPITPEKTTNATLQLLHNEEDEADQAWRVRVMNAADSKDDRFFVRWSGEKETSPNSSDETAVYVPPGESRVVRVPRPENAASLDRLLLRGDDHDFDNTFFVAVPRKQQISVLYAGDDAADDPQGFHYYLRLAVADDPLREVAVQPLDLKTMPQWSGPLAPSLIVATKSWDADILKNFESYITGGGTLLLVPGNEESTSLLPRFLDDITLAKSVPPRSPDEFHLLGEIDFRHPLFASFAHPKYGDFTKIHFWRRFVVELPEKSSTHVIARFDNGDPWMLERTVGRGRILALTSGWRPDDGQLALSSKFVPLVGNMLDQACGFTRPPLGITVNEAVPLPTAHREAIVVRSPDGRETKFAADAREFEATDVPGIYDLGDDSRFAVNLAATESDTAPLDLERFEQLGVRMGADVSSTERLNRVRQQRDVELESRQKVWQWLLACCLVILIFETWWAGRGSRNLVASTSEAMA